MPIGTLKLTRKNTSVSAWCDKLALANTYHIAYLSLIAPANVIKAFGAALNGHLQNTAFDYEDLEWKDAAGGRPSYRPAGLYPMECRYRRHVHRLGFDWVHCVWVAKDPCLLLSIDSGSVWAALKRPEITTPLLRAWVPYLTRELLKTGHIVRLYGHECHCGRLTAKTADVDRAVAAGLKSGELTLQDDKPDDFGMADNMAKARVSLKRRRAV
jgi:hypothetical protein